MSVADDKPQSEAEGADPSDEPAAPTSSGLTRPLQEHLGQQLRTTYETLAEKPAFLGDANVPAELDRHVQRLETRERIRNKGLEAVRTALQGVDGPKPAAKRDQGRRGGA